MNQTRQQISQDQTAEDLLAVIQSLVTEVHPRRPPTDTIDLDSHFEKDIGLDSLTRVELISRVERHFDLALPERSFAEVETARELLRAMLDAGVKLTAAPPSRTRATPLERAETAPREASTLLDVLDWHVENHPQRTHIQLLGANKEGGHLSYQQLKAGALGVTAGLQRIGIQPAEPVAIMLPSSAEYFYSFFGVLMAGGIPVPVYPPARPSQLEDHMLRHARILSNCRAITLITVPEAKNVARLLRSHVTVLKNIVTITELTAVPSVAKPPVLHGDDIAFIQYTSGSTGHPKGVVLTHANLLANIRAMGETVQVSSTDVFVSWLPLYHDMGLIGAWLGSLYYAMLLVVMPPLSFLAHPERWLWAIHQYRGTLSASPNFGYEYCLKRLSDENLEGLDLSSWRAAFNGAEAVSPETVKQFAARFSHYGFRADAMMPVYGLAESSVGLAFPPLNRGPWIDQIDRSVFMSSGRAEPAAKAGQDTLQFVSSGSPLPGHQVRIVDAAGRELPECQEGRLQFRGPSATSGYYRDTENTRKLFHHGWLDSGDLAYISSGEIFITGRIKDIIIRAGRNIYPHELEEAVGAIPGIRTGRVAVFGSSDTVAGTERLIVMAETHSTDTTAREQLRGEINALATDLVGAPPDEVVLAPPGTVLKTSSGKIRRAASRELYEKGRVGSRRRGLPWQLVRLTLSGARPQLRRLLDSLATSAYALYCWPIFILLAVAAWCAAIVVPRLSWRWSALRACARALGKLTATPLRVHGLGNLPTDNHNCVLVANHASYIDSFALVAALPSPFRFVAKAELANNFLVRWPLKGIQTEYVERADISKSVSDSQHLCRVLKQGNALMFFPEGTFTRIPGLTNFRLGAFTLAAEAGVPVIPVAIRGTRSIFRPEGWFLRRGAIQIEIGKPIDPLEVASQVGEDSWQVALALRERSRLFILRHCGEPDLA